MQIDKLLTGGWLVGKRTYLVGIGMIVTAMTQYAAGDMPLTQALPEVLEGLAWIFGRSAIGRIS
jgi:hypothetical protein